MAFSLSARVLPASAIQSMVSGRLEQHVTRIAEAQQRVRAQGEALERRFLGFGAMVEQLNQASISMTSNANLLVELASGKRNGETVVASTLALLGTPLDFLVEAAGGLCSVSEHLKGLDAVAASIHAAEPALNMAIRPLDSLQVLFRIESATLNHDVQQMFQALMGDIDVLQSRVRESFSENTRLLNDTRSRLLGVLDKLQTAGELGRTVDARKTSMAGALLHLREEVESGSESNLALKVMTSGLAADVDGIIVTLQTHDIVSQKLSHIQDAVTELLSRVAGLGGGRSLRILASDLEDAIDLARVQIHQVEAVRENLSRSAAGSTSAVRQVSARLQTMDQDCLLLTDLKAMTAAADGMVQVLLDSIEEVRRLSAESTAIARWVYDAVGPIAGGAASLSSDIEDITSQMRRIALNTQIQAVNVGGNTGLEVIAAQTQCVSADAMHVSTEVSLALKQLQAGLGEAVGSLGKLENSGSAGYAALVEATTAKELELHALRDETITLVQTTSQALESIAGLTEAMNSELDFGTIVDDDLQPLEGLLADLLEELSLIRSAVTRKDATATATDASARSYTMESERRTHAAALGHHAPPVAEAASEGDVEFF